MDAQTLMMVTLGMLALMGWWANYSKRNKILIYYNRVNKTQVTKWVSMKGKHIIFDGLKFDIIPSRIIFRWYNGGLIHMIFPQWVATLTYSYNSRFPHDPNNMDYNAETPEVRNALNLQEWVLSYFRGAKPSQGKPSKVGLVEKYLPWAAILLVVVVAWYFNSKMSGFGSQLDAIIGQLPK